MNLNWRNIYADQYPKSIKKKKFSILPKPIPWGQDFDDNVWMTIEWLIRDGRHKDIRFSEEPVLNFIRDGWYRCEFEDGKFIHVCYPSEMLKFRSQYDGIHSQIMESIDNQTKIEFNMVNTARNKLWSAWKCHGCDGGRELLTELNFEAVVDLDLNTAMYGKQVWNNQCSRCCAPLPKALQMWVQLRHSKLKDIR